jgi:hypothetical protein
MYTRDTLIAWSPQCRFHVEHLIKLDLSRYWSFIVSVSFLGRLRLRYSSWPLSGSITSVKQRSRTPRTRTGGLDDPSTAVVLCLLSQCTCIALINLLLNVPVSLRQFLPSAPEAVELPCNTELPTLYRSGCCRNRVIRYVMMLY